MDSALGLPILVLSLSLLGLMRAESSTIDQAQVHRGLIHLRIQLDSPLPAGSLVICKAEVTAGKGVFSPREGVSTQLPDPDSGVCALEIPLCWTGYGAVPSVTIRYEVDVTVRPGSFPVVLKSGVQSANLAAGTPAMPSTVSYATIP
jgi:hypothetical protein